VAYGLRVEWLEDRTLLSGNTIRTATPLTFGPFQTTQVSHFLNDPKEEDLYQVTLNPGDRLNASISAQGAGSGLQSLLRIFDSHGNQMALDDQEGGDPRLTFQAPQGTIPAEYFVGVSSAPNDGYNPYVADSGSAGGTTGLYTLNLRVTAATAQADVTGSSFRLDQSTAAYGESISGSFTVENRGGASSTGFTVQVVLSGGTRFDGFDPSATLSTVLASSPRPVLAAGQSYTSSFTATLPPAMPANFPSASGPVYVGLLITPKDPAADSGQFDKSSVHRGEDWETLTIVTPYSVSGNHDQFHPFYIQDPNGRVDETDMLAVGLTDWYSFTIPTTGQLTVKVTATAGSTLVPRLTLYGVDSGNNPVLLTQADDGSLESHVRDGNYFLTVSAQTGSGTYQLVSEFVEAEPPFDPLAVGAGPRAGAVAELTGDGHLDLVVANGNDGNVSVLLGNGDGSFQTQQLFPVGNKPVAVAVADLNGDGRPNLIVANYDDNTVSVLLGNDDGTFQPQHTFMVGSHPVAVAVADVNGDGNPDLVVTNAGDNTVTVLLGNGQGSFGQQQTFPAGTNPDSVAVADVNSDGKPDLIVADKVDGMVSVLANQSTQGASVLTFAPRQTFTVGANPVSVAVADLTGDGQPDLIVANQGDNATPGSVSVLRNSSGSGMLSFATQQTFTVGLSPTSVAVADVNGDGNLDLIVANQDDSTVSVLLGNGSGSSGVSFQPQRSFATGVFPAAVAVGDVNGDGKPDLVTFDFGGDTASVLLGNGDGTFQDQPGLGVGPGPQSVAVADLNGDGKPDLIVADSASNTVSVLLGNGDGSFQPRETFAVGRHPQSVAVADLNGDGRPDIVVANKDSNTVSVLLGNGDGTFQAQTTYPVGESPFSVAVADLNGDGIPDLIVANKGNGNDPSTVSVLLGNGDGTFGPQQTFPVGINPLSVAVAGDATQPDFRGLLREPDLVVANHGKNPTDGSLTLLLNNTAPGAAVVQFTTQTVPAGSYPGSVAVGDINGDGLPDVVLTYSTGTGSVGVLLNKTGKGAPQATFASPATAAVGSYPRGVAVADVTGDGKPDVVVANYGGQYASVLVNQTQQGSLTAQFASQQTVPTGPNPTAVVVGDVNGDGKPDLITASTQDNNVSVLLGNGNNPFQTTTPTPGVEVRNTPYQANLTGHQDGTTDLVILDRSGNILFRRGLGNNDFSPPQTINATVLNSTTNTMEEITARDLTVLQTAAGPVIATADSLPDPNILATQHKFQYSVSLYTYDPATGTFNHTTAFTTPFLPTHIVAAKLTPNDPDDLIVANALDNSITIAFPPATGTTWSTITRAVGVTPSDIALVNGDSTRRPDIVVSDQVSGDVTVLSNDQSATPQFPERRRFRASTGLYDLTTMTANPSATSLARSVSLVADNFTGSGRQDVVVVNRGADSFSVLTNDGNGGFANPQVSKTTSTSDGSLVNAQPGAVVPGAFNTNSSNFDLAILMEDRGEVWIYTGNGNGTFTHTASYAVGDLPTGLTVVRGSALGLFDLLVGDQFGDILRLQGKGNGTFAPPVLMGSPLQATFFNQQSTPDVLVGDQKDNLVTVQEPVAVGSTTFTVQQLATNSAKPNSTLAPGAVQWLPLDGSNHLPDAVIIDSGSNQVLVYHTQSVDPATGLPTFSSLTPDAYAVGDNPVSVTMDFLSSTTVPDLIVANKGSNDVSLLFGSIDATTGLWKGTPGPRLQSGGKGPIAVNVVSDPNSRGGKDLVVTNGRSGTLTVLPGVGQGFFNDQNPQTLTIPGLPNGTPISTISFPSGSNSGVAVIGDGQTVFGINLDIPASSRGVLFNAPANQLVTAVQALPNDGFAVAETGGTTAIFTPESGFVEQDLTPLTGLPPGFDPSALDVVGDQVLVTDSGSDQIFVFGPSLTEPLTSQPVPLPDHQMPGGPVPEPTSPPEAPLTVVVTLAAGLLTSTTPSLEGNPTGGPALDTSGEQPATHSDTTEASVEIIQGASDDTVLASEGPHQPSNESDSLLDELLHDLELYRIPDEKPRGNPISQQPGQRLPLGPAAFAALWQDGVDWRTAEDVAEADVAFPADMDTTVATWLAVASEAEQDVAVPARATTPNAIVARATAGVGPQVATQAALGEVVVEVRTPANVEQWTNSLVAILGVGALALWTERRLAQPATTTEHDSKPRLLPRE
jgi:hypothetical protein